MQTGISGRCIALACEGGGSHASFTAGVLERMLADNVRIVALSGASGGAVSAMLAWRGLLEGDRADAVRRLRAFWRDVAVDGWEAVGGAWLLFGARMIGEFASPEVSPYRIPVDLRRAFASVLDRHCGFSDIPDLLRGDPAAPRLLIGASDVRTGQFSAFRSHAVRHQGVDHPATTMTADVLLASAALPTLFRAVHIAGHDHWDGVFAQNPPVRELPDMVRTIPGGVDLDEIWVIRINPQTRQTVPTSMAEIRDRRNELSGIISLNQELYFIDRINRLVAQGQLDGTKHRRIALRSITMDGRLAAGLDYESKRDRSRTLIERLRQHGLERAERFLRDPDDHLLSLHGSGTP